MKTVSQNTAFSFDGTGKTQAQIEAAHRAMRTEQEIGRLPIDARFNVDRERLRQEWQNDMNIAFRKDFAFCYNTDVQLYVNIRGAILSEQDKCLRDSLQVSRGHIIYRREAIGRFPDNEDAVAALKEAGFVCRDNIHWEAE